MIRWVALVVAGCLWTQTARADETVLENFRRGAGFAANWGQATVEPMPDPDFPHLRIQTAGGGEPVFVSNVRPYAPQLDLTGKFLKLWIRVDGVEHAESIEFRFSSNRFSSDYFAFGLPVYDDPEFGYAAEGVWHRITFSFGHARVEGKPDRAAIDSIGVYLADDGTGSASLSWGAVTAVEEAAEGIVSLTFDDGYDEHFDVAARVMAKHGLAGTAYVIPEAVGQSGYVTLHELVRMQEWGWDIAAHHETPFTTFEPEKLESVILGIQEYLLAHGFGRGAGHLAYPLGKQNGGSVREFVRRHFDSARVAGHGPETLPPADRHLLRVYNVLKSTKPGEIRDAVRRAREHKEWLILMFHYLVAEPETDIDYSIADFEKAIKLIAKEGVRVAPVATVFDEQLGTVPAAAVRRP